MENFVRNRLFRSFYIEKWCNNGICMKIWKFHMKAYLRSEWTNYFPIVFYCNKSQNKPKLHTQRCNYSFSDLHSVIEPPKSSNEALPLPLDDRHFWALFYPWRWRPLQGGHTFKQNHAYRNATEHHKMPWISLISTLEYRNLNSLHVFIILNQSLTSILSKIIPLSSLLKIKNRFIQRPLGVCLLWPKERPKLSPIPTLLFISIEYLSTSWIAKFKWPRKGNARVISILWSQPLFENGSFWDPRGPCFAYFVSINQHFEMKLHFI